jgi:GT2 family glycosyltransferase
VPEPSRAPSVSCVIVAFHRVDVLREVLRDLAHPAIEAVVVNVENDADVAAAADGQVVVALQGNPGYAAAVNAGAAVASAPVVVFMNDDARIGAEDALRLAGALDDGWIDVVVPRVVDGRGNREPTIAALPTPSSLLREWMLLPDRRMRSVARRLHVQKWRDPIGAERIDAASAAVVGTRRSLLTEVPLPEHYFMYWEESEWFWHLHRRGAVVQVRPEVVCRHDGGRDDVRAAKSRLLARNAVRCVRRTQGRSAAVAAWIVVVGWNTRLLLVDTARAVVRPSRRALARVGARLAGFAAALTSLTELR